MQILNMKMQHFIICFDKLFKSIKQTNNPEMFSNHERKGDRDNQQDVTLPVMTVTNPRTLCQVRS